MPNASQPDAFASWDSESGQWTQPDELNDALFGPSEPFSGRWPTSGITLRGVAYALPTWEPPTEGGESSSSPGLPTPRASRGASSTETVALLPTPTVQDGANDGGPSQFDRNSLPLNTLVKTL